MIAYLDSDTFEGSVVYPIPIYWVSEWKPSECGDDDNTIDPLDCITTFVVVDDKLRIMPPRETKMSDFHKNTIKRMMEFLFPDE